MTTMTRTGVTVTGGVDTHLDVHVAAVVNELGAVLGTRSFPTTPTGYRQLLGWMSEHGAVQRVGVEGTGTYGVGLTRFLTGREVPVVEVDRPNRQVRRRHGKTDTVDAIAGSAGRTGWCRNRDTESRDWLGGGHPRAAAGDPFRAQGTHSGC